MDDFDNDGVEDLSEDRIGLRYQLTPKDITRRCFGLTAGLGSFRPKPSAKYVYQDLFAKDLNFQFTQRFTYDLGKGSYATARFVLDKALRERDIVRAYTSFCFGSLSLRTTGTSTSPTLIERESGDLSPD